MKNSSTSERLSFSILMANYNNGRYITESIRSVLSQTNNEWELIIVDDCSTDDSIEKIKQFLNDNRIKLLRHKKNRGYGAALKTAADNAKNPILAILDSDDKLSDNALEIMANAHRKNPDYGFIYSTMWRCDSELNICDIAVRTEPGEIENIDLYKSNISHFKTIRKDIYDKTYGYDPNQRRSVDKDLIYKLDEVTRFKLINEPLYYYRRHRGGISRGKNRFIASIYHYIAKCKTYRRRLNTDLPNFTIRELYIEYYKITFHKLILFLKKLFRLFRISEVVIIILRLYSKMPEKIRKIFELIEKKL